MSSPTGRSAVAATLLGHDYQHLIAWNELLPALRAGSTIASIAVEAVDAASYDDVVITPAAGAARFMQAKFAVDGTSVFGIDYLTEALGRGKVKSSLAKKALAAFHTLTATTGVAPTLELVTNRVPAPDDELFTRYRDPEDSTLGAAVRRLLNGQVTGKGATLARQQIATLAGHLGLTAEELLPLLDVWVLRTGVDIAGQRDLAKAQMLAAGLDGSEDAVTRGREIVRQLVKKGRRELSRAELVEIVDHAGLRIRAPYRVLSIEAIAADPFATQADAHIDLRDLFDGRQEDAARGLQDPSLWSARAIPSIDQAAANLRAQSSDQRILVRGAMRLPLWFATGYAMRHVSGWTVACEQNGQVWSSDDPVPAISPLVVSWPMQGDAPQLAVVVSLVRDALPAALKFVRSDLGDVRVLSLGWPGGPSDTSVASGGHAAALAQHVRDVLTSALERVGTDRVHLFMAAPKSFALNLGHRWHRLAPVTVYEDLGAGRGYQAAVDLAG
jgi:hypothetical protein